MTKTELLQTLKNHVSPTEHDLILSGKMPNISTGNANTIIAMMAAPADRDLTAPVDIPTITHLKTITYAYLEQYFSQAPEAWKWILIACIYNTFILEIPMHPKESIPFKTREIDGKTIYYCPAKTREPDTNCSFCVCKFVDEY